ncbi:MAG: thiamine phosphate synthase [Candidatus Krumholzibacteria bacterium]|nr:thiamine phosphate synthase [Candidatus Krumholzibacteria bacterium]
MSDLNHTERSVVVRIIDVNANRCAEGLRVVEEIARFSLEDGGLTGRLKEIRHEVRGCVEQLAGGALAHRDSVDDVGSGSATAAELARSTLASVARANFARAEEALRVLEEFGKLMDESASRVFKSHRFAVYEIERCFFALERPAVGMPRSPFLYAILDRGIVARGDAGRIAEALAAGGADMIQYRAKDIDETEKRQDMAAILGAVRGAAIPVIVNDDVELAHETGADGVHIGVSDMPPLEARAIMGTVGIIGVTVPTLDDLGRLPLDAIDYVAVGAVYPTTTKRDAKKVGVGFLRSVRDRTAKPLVAIGGIGPWNAEEILDAGADGIAVASALLVGDVRKNCFTLKEIVAKRLQRGKD